MIHSKEIRHIADGAIKAFVSIFSMALLIFAYGPLKAGNNTVRMPVERSVMKIETALFGMG